MLRTSKRSGLVFVAALAVIFGSQMPADAQNGPQIPGNKPDVPGHFHAVTTIPPAGGYPATFISEYAAMRTGTLFSNFNQDRASFQTKELWVSANSDANEELETGDTIGSFNNLVGCTVQNCNEATGNYFAGTFCGEIVYDSTQRQYVYEESTIQSFPPER